MRIVLPDEGVGSGCPGMLGTTLDHLSWKRLYEKEDVLGLATVHPGRSPQKLTPQLRAKVLERNASAAT